MKKNRYLIELKTAYRKLNNLAKMCENVKMQLFSEHNAEVTQSIMWEENHC